MDIMSAVGGLIFNVVSLPHVASHSIHPSYRSDTVSIYMYLEKKSIRP